MMEILRHYGIDLSITLIAIVVVGIFLSPLMIVPLIILLIMEISFSFDNAVVNAKVLERMSPIWQKMFLTVGIFIAVFGMRFLFPIAIVAITAGIGFGDVVNLAFGDAVGYAEKLDAAHPLISMFGGVYLMLIFLTFIFEDRDTKWLHFIEKPLAKVGKLANLSYVLTGVFILIAAATFGHAHQLEILTAGFVAMILFMAVNALSSIFEVSDDEHEKKPVRHGWGAFALFMYLEVQDSAFSLDGVSAAFAVTNSIVLIAIGLGVGSLFVRSMTVHLVKTGKLAEFRYLEHGAHWAIGALALCMLIGVSSIHIPEYVVGLVGVVFIVSALVHSHRVNTHETRVLATS